MIARRSPTGTAICCWRSRGSSAPSWRRTHGLPAGCGVMVNISDVAAMGGRPIAVVDAIWASGNEAGDPILAGLRDASAGFGVPIVGGHTNLRADSQQLSVAILGRAQRLLTSFDAAPGDRLIAAIDLRGRYRDPFPNWEAATSAPADRPARRYRTAAAHRRGWPLRGGQGYQPGRPCRHGDDARRMLSCRPVHRCRRGAAPRWRGPGPMAAEFSEFWLHPLRVTRLRR